MQLNIISISLFPHNASTSFLQEDDWAEENDAIIMAYLLPTQSKEYKPTTDNPDAGLISLEGDMDWFAIALLLGDQITIRIEFNGSQADLNLFFADSTGNVLDQSVLSGSNSETVVYQIVEADYYFFLIMGVGPSDYGFAEYNMTVNIDLFDDKFELPNNDFTTAAPIPEGFYSNLILRDDLYDCYSLFLNEADTITISLDYFPEEYEEAGDTFVNDIDLEFYSYTGTEYSRVDESITLGNESLSYIASSSGQYFILCILWGGETPNSYNLTIDILETDDTHEDNDVFADATRITVFDGSTRDTVSHIETPRIRIKDDDYFVVHIPIGLAIIVEISQFEPVDLNLELLSMNGSIIETSALGAGFSERVGPFTIKTSYANLNNDTDIYFRVFMSTGLSTSYLLNVTIGPDEILIPPLPFSDWGDVVHVNYSLWLDLEHTIEVPGNIGVVLEYIYLRRSVTESVPTEVFQTLPDAADEYLQQIYLQAFIDEIIGMQVNEEKSFMIAAADAYGDEDLFYQVTLLVLVYDASEITSTSENTSETSLVTSSAKTTVIKSSTSENTSLQNITSSSDLVFIFFILFASVIVIKKKRRMKYRLE